MEPNPQKEETPQPNQDGAEKPKKALFAVSDLMQDGRDIFISFNGKQLKYDRATPMGVAYNKLQSAGIKEYWRLALEAGPKNGKKMPSETDNIEEPPKRRSWLERLFGSKPAEPAKVEPPRKFFIPGIPDYAGSAEALGIQANAVVQAVAVTENGTSITMTDGQKITADPKSDLARSVAVLLEEFDAIGHNHAKAREAVNRPLGRPIVRMRQFGKVQAKTRGKKLGESEAIDGGVAVDLDSSAQAPSISARNGTGETFSPEVRKLEHYPVQKKTGGKKINRSSGEIKNSAPTAPEIPEPLSKTGDDIKTSTISTQVTEPSAAPQRPEGSSENAPLDSESVYPEEEVVNSENNPVEEPYPENLVSKEEPETSAPEAEVSFVAETPEKNRDLDGYVLVEQRARPKAEGPFTLEARTQEKVDGKYKSITQFNVSKKDYAVVSWLAQKKIKSTYKISIVPPDETNPERGIPVGVIEDVQVKNEAGFVSLSWKQLREEFEKANNLSHRPEFQDALKSAEIESASTTTMLPGVRLPAPPREQDIGGGGGLRPLPKLRPVNVPKALEDPGHSF